jgi:phospholipid transport system transporter-binding protein
MSAIRREGASLRVEGPVHMVNARALMSEGNALLEAGVTTIDMGAVTEVDSSAVSLLLEWQRTAAGRKASLRFANLPESLKSLAALYGVTDLLPQ